MAKGLYTDDVTIKVSEDSTTKLSCWETVCVHRDTGVLSVNPNGPIIDYESNANGDITFFIWTEDNGGNCLGLTNEDCFVTGQHTIQILNANDAPVWGSPPSLSINENSPIGTTIGSYLAGDEDNGDQLSYTIYSNLQTGEISKTVGYSNLNLIVLDKSFFNYEERQFIQVYLSVNDNSVVAPGSYTANTSITINIIDINEPPRWPTQKQFSATCDGQKGSRIGDQLSNYVEDDRCMYTRGGCVGSSELFFKKVNGSAKINVTEEGVVYKLNVASLDNNCKPKVTVDTQHIWVSVQNTVGEKIYQKVVIQPTSGFSEPYFNFTLGTPTVSFPESADSSTAALCVEPYCPKIFAEDLDTGTKLSYSISGSSDLFSITSNINGGYKNMGTFDVHLVNNAVLDYELNGCGASLPNHACSFFVVANDNSDLYSVPQKIKVLVTDTNDRPCASSASSPNCPTIEVTINENTPLNTVIITVSNWIDNDFDNSVHKNMKDNEATFVVVNSQGTTINPSTNTLIDNGLELKKDNTNSGTFSISIQSNINYETLKSNELKGQIKWSVQASDSLLSATGTVIVTVLDVNEPPTLTLDTNDIKAMEVDILSDSRLTKTICNSLSSDYVWTGDKCQIIDESASIVAIQVNDVDDSNVNIIIQSIIGIDVDGIRTSFTTTGTQTNPVMFQLWNGVTKNCNAIQAGTSCTLKRSSGVPLPNFDYEKYVQFEVIVNGTEIEDTCSQGVRPRPGGTLPQFDVNNCNRFTLSKTILVNVIDVNDVLIESIEYIGSMSRTSRDRFTLSTHGGDLINITGNNFGAIRPSLTQLNQLTDVFEVNYNAIRLEIEDDSSNTINALSYVARNCQRLSTTNNRVLTCYTSGGYGRRHRWYVHVQRSSTIQHRSIPLSELATQSSYRPPSVSSISVAGISNSNQFDTAGGTKITITGNHLGTTSEWNSNKNGGGLVSTSVYQYFGDATLVYKNGKTFEIKPVDSHVGMNSRCSLPSTLSRFLQGTNQNIVIQSDAVGELEAVTYGVRVELTSQESNKACFSQQRWVHRGCWSYNQVDVSNINSEPNAENSNPDRKYFDRDSNNNIIDILHKCGTAAEKAGRSHFGIYNGNVCKFSVTLENLFFRATKHLQSFNSDSCLSDENGNMDVYELNDQNLSRRSVMMTKYVTQISTIETGTAIVDILKTLTNTNTDRIWSIYAQSTGFTDMSNVGVDTGPYSGTRYNPNGFQILSGKLGGKKVIFNY